MKWLAGVLFRILYHAVALRRPPNQIIYSHLGHPYLLRWYLFGDRGDGLSRRPFGRTLYLHCFVSSDDDRALHDHPADFTTFILRGGYDEIVPSAAVYSERGKLRSVGSGAIRRSFRAGSLRSSKAADPHRVDLWPQWKPAGDFDGYEVHELLEQHGAGKLGGWAPPPYPHVVELSHLSVRLSLFKPCWTLFYFAKRTRQWGFWCPQGWKHWKDFDQAGGC